MLHDKIFIIIVTYNGMKWIDACLKSTNAYEVIVVDNNSADGTADYILATYPDVEVIQQRKNLGFGRANNIGISIAYGKGCRGVFLLNQDAYLFPDTIERLDQFYKRNRDYGLLSPMHLAGDNYHLDRNFKDYILSSTNRDFISDSLNNRLGESYDVPFVNAAAWYIPRKSIEKIGGFDPIFDHYGEDENYCQRLRYHDLKIGIVSEAMVIHDRNQNPKQSPSIYSSEYYEQLERVYKVELADINRDLSAVTIKEIYFSRKVAYYKAYIKLNAKQVRKAKADLRMLRELLPQIIDSRNKSMTIGSHYLKF